MWLIFGLAGVSAAFAQLTVREIMAEPSMAGMRAEGEKLSPDGTKVIYLWNADAKLPRDLYLANTRGGAPEIILRLGDLPAAPVRAEKENKLDYGLLLRDDFVKERERSLGNFEWSPDSSKLLFSHAGDLFILTLGEKEARRLTQTQAAETAMRFIDKDRILYQLSGNLFLLNTSNSFTLQLTKEADAGKAVFVGNAAVSKDGKMAAYVVSDASKYRTLSVPSYLGEYTESGTVRRGWADHKLFVTTTDGSRAAAIEIELPKPEGVGNFRSVKWTADNRGLVVDRVDKDLKRRQLFFIANASDKTAKQTLITEDTDEKWQAPLSSIVEPDPANERRVFFGSERDGFNHLYLAEIKTDNPADVAIKQITSGRYQVEWAKWAAGGERIIYLSTEPTPQERMFFSIEMDGMRKLKLPSMERGMRNSPQIDETNSMPVLLYGLSAWDRPEELYAMKTCPGCRGMHMPEKLTSTTPAAFLKRPFVEPEFVSIPSRDGKQIPAKIYRPKNFDAKKKHPMVIFVHGAGYLQNVINGWNNYYREFLFNQMLAEKGFVVLDIDYRGSAGYGREWRTDVYDFLGGKDLDDHIDAIDHMVKNYSVDKGRVGVYGGSYGGFIAEMLAFRASEKVAAAAALRPVADWKNYYASSPGYTVQRLGFPDKNPEAYKRSSPITYADGLKTNLLILHGMADDNVHVQDSVQLTEKLIRLGKTQYFDVMLYPSENHAFVRPESWADEYERILAFLEKHLK